MKKLLLLAIAGAILSVSTPSAHVEAQAFVDAYAIPKRYVFKDGWPQWIGRISAQYFTYDDQPEMAAKYLPLSLVKTGGFANLVEQVESTPNVDITNWPQWIGKLRNSN